MSLLPFTREPSLLDKAWMAARYPIDLVASPIRAVVSIPALSFLVIPALSSYGTSVNLLFFYMTWAILIRSNDPIAVELYGTLGIRTLFYILPSLFFLLLDSAFPTVAANIKELGEPALPMSEEQGGRKGSWWKVSLVSVGNVLLSVLLQVGLELFVTHVLRLRSLLKISTTVPFPWSIAKDLFIGLLLREIFTYISHRYVLHSEHTMLSELHQSWQHGVRLPFSLVAHYDHPIAYLLHVFAPMFLPAVLLRFHFLTYQIYLILVSLEETFAYSGYNVLPSAFILGGLARRRENHLLRDGNGNYGCFGMADLLMGTSLGTEITDDITEEAKEENVGKKANRKARDLSNKVSKRKSQERHKPGPEKEAMTEDEDEGSLRRRGVSPKEKGKNEHGDEESNEEGSNEEAYSPVRKSNRTKTGRKRTSEDSGHEDRKAQGKAPVRKSSQKGQAGSRPRRRSIEKD